jgi:hypothetical protein
VARRYDVNVNQLFLWRKHYRDEARLMVVDPTGDLGSDAALVKSHFGSRLECRFRGFGHDHDDPFALSAGLPSEFRAAVTEEVCRAGDEAVPGHVSENRIRQHETDVPA